MRAYVLVVAFEAARRRQSRVCLWSGGGVSWSILWVHSRYWYFLVNSRGYTSLTFCKNGGAHFSALCPAFPFGPNKWTKTKQKRVCVLSMGCGRIASALVFRLPQVGTRGSAWRWRVLPTLAPRNGRKARGISHCAQPLGNNRDIYS